MDSELALGSSPEQAKILNGFSETIACEVHCVSRERNKGCQCPDHDNWHLTGVGKQLSRVAHNHEITGANPVSSTLQENTNPVIGGP